MASLCQKPIKIENSTVNPCSGCLSVDRKLWPLTENTELFHLLLGPGYSAENESEYCHMHLCWECRALLHKARQYQLRIQQAQFLLQQTAHTFIHPGFATLSNLTIKKTDNSSTENEDQTLIQVDSKPFNIIIENLEPKNNIIENIHNEEFDDFEVALPDNELDDIKLENNDNQSDNEHENKTAEPEKQTKSCKMYRYRNYKNVKTVTFSHEDNANHYSELTLNKKQFDKLLNRAARYKCYTSKRYKCKECVIGFEAEHELLDHLQIHDKAFGQYSCNTCKIYFKTKEDEQYHLNRHCTAYRCNLCHYKSVKLEDQVRHVKKKHQVVHKCRTCDEIFGLRIDFYRHYKEVHTKFVCDYCGRVSRKKHKLAAHIRRNHLRKECKVCKRSLSSYDNLEKHYRHVHKMELNEVKRKKKRSPPVCMENMYCVECDKQYETEHQYKQHLRNSMKHASKRPYKTNVPCPECGKIFSRTNYMNNHYKLFHEKATKHHCVLCDKYFSTGYGLRKHKMLVHDKIPLPRDKVCTECGRAFALNRTLIHHMRTHTGERPHACALCPARFAQRTALLTHVKAIHGKRQNMMQ